MTAITEISALSAALPDLQTTAQLLEQNGFPTAWVAPAEDVPLEQILVVLDEEPQPEGEEAELVMQLYFLDQSMNSPDEDELCLLNFSAEMPIRQEDKERMLDTYKLLMDLNRLLPIGLLEINETQQICYRYTLLSDIRSHLTLNHLIEVLDMAGFFLNRLKPALQAFCAGEMSYEEACEDAENRLTDLGADEEE